MDGRSVPRCCPSCGQQAELYRGRLLSLVHDNKALALENRQLKAELLLLRRQASRASMTGHPPPVPSSSPPSTYMPTDSTTALLREIEVKLNQFPKSRLSSSWSAPSTSAFPNIAAISASPRQPSITPPPTYLGMEDPLHTSSQPPTSQPPSNKAFAWTAPPASTSNLQHNSAPSDPASPTTRSPLSPKSASRVSVSDLVGPDEESTRRVEHLTRQLDDIQATLLASRTTPEAMGDGPDARATPAPAPAPQVASLPPRDTRKVRSLSPRRHGPPPPPTDGSTVMALDLAHRDWLSEDVLGFGVSPAQGRRRDGRSRGGRAATTAPAASQSNGLQDAMGGGGEEVKDPRVEAMKDQLFLELKRRLPTERAIDFLDHMKQLNAQTISYQEAWNEAYALLGPLNMDLFHGFLKVLYGTSARS